MPAYSLEFKRSADAPYEFATIFTDSVVSAMRFLREVEGSILIRSVYRTTTLTNW